MARLSASFKMMDHLNQLPPSIKHLYPSLEGEDLRSASENIQRYLNLVLRVARRLESDPPPRSDPNQK